MSGTIFRIIVYIILGPSFNKCLHNTENILFCMILKVTF